MPLELVPPGTHIDFIGKRHVAVGLSAVMIAASIAAVPLRGIKLGIDFAGGTEVQVLFSEGGAVDEGAVRSVVSVCGVSDPSVVRYGDLGASEFLIRFRQVEAADAEALAAESADTCPLTDEQRTRLAEVAEAAGGSESLDDTGSLVDRLAMALGNEIGPVEIERVEYVGPRVGSELSRDGLYALTIAGLLILFYIAFRFSMRFAPGAIVALIHDLAITSGIFVLMGWEFDLRVLAALLAILGYSLNDTIIIYDRIRENMELHTKYNLIDVLNRSVNQTLSRTILTSGTTMAAVLSLRIVGGEVLEPFANAMLIGIVVGTYSSVFIAAPTLLFLETRAGAAEAGGPRPERAKPEKRSGPDRPSKVSGPRGASKRSKRGKRKRA